ncbi:MULTISPECIES: helix-turn-helix transcriptional regulator [Thalassotalea]|uniref:Helix-turn-helix transcriptional regulator n=1 Tax=Thalassotalea castellviae TaxID=3075612 RepID=A0ABU3A4X9_9GAMM|nr:helix-turn-helix transcriptional regulator [Thalassotalea sp. W431]MDT0605230.1 helix-turn-helix transcriptional regulator [Thalassotalea sp. W431]
MILAEKIIKLRKQLSWSQEELAEKMDVSRQSVSKWESTNSIPDLNKVIKLAEIFDVSTDYLLKDDIEIPDLQSDGKEPGSVQINLEQALHYVETKRLVSSLITKGVVFCISSVIPLFFFLAMAQTGRLNMTGNVAAVAGIVSILLMVSVAVSYFIKTNQYQAEIDSIENEPFELSYGVHSVFQEKLKDFQNIYHFRLSLGIFMFIISFVPLLVASMFMQGEGLTLMMLIVLFIIIAIGICIVSPVSAKFDAYNNILKDNVKETEKSKRAKRAEKLAAFYWPLLVAIFLGWSLWTMDWGVTWIIWPVGAVLFAALIGLMELFEKNET